jgi:hypothetical protein
MESSAEKVIAARKLTFQIKVISFTSNLPMVHEWPPHLTRHRMLFNSIKGVEFEIRRDR